jgi:outer membrane biosynthesis protein TonB
VPPVRRVDTPGTELYEATERIVLGGVLVAAPGTQLTRAQAEAYGLIGADVEEAPEDVEEAPEGGEEAPQEPDASQGQGEPPEGAQGPQEQPQEPEQPEPDHTAAVEIPTAPSRGRGTRRG